MIQIAKNRLAILNVTLKGLTTLLWMRKKIEFRNAQLLVVGEQGNPKNLRNLGNPRNPGNPENQENNSVFQKPHIQALPGFIFQQIQLVGCRGEILAPINILEQKPFKYSAQINVYISEPKPQQLVIFFVYRIVVRIPPINDDTNCTTCPNIFID